MRYLAIFLPVLFGYMLYRGVEVWPALASKEMLLGVASFFALAWTSLALALPKLSGLLALEGMTSGQREALAENIKLARKKIWRIGAISLSCVITLFLLSVVARPDYAHFIAGFAGIASGFAIELLFAYKRWHDEIHDFTALVLQRHFEAKAAEEAVSRLSKSA